VSKDGEEGFPGTLTVTAVYTLTSRNALKTEFTGTTDKDTIVNLTQHSYFNLKGAGNGDILDHLATIHAERFTPIDAKSIPLGDLRPVKGTPFDFTHQTRIGERIDADDQQLKNGRGYDHNFVVAVYKAGGAPHVVARVEEPTTGRVLEVASDQPGVQFYTGNFLDGTLTGKGGKVYRKRYGFALEPGHYPDSPNHPQWPSVELKPGQTYHNTIIFGFSVQP
jgi:aldose 1-epimerase